jgi:hypothetical protein
LPDLSPAMAAGVRRIWSELVDRPVDDQHSGRKAGCLAAQGATFDH